MEFEDEEAAASAIRKHRRFPIVCRNRCLRIAYPASNAMNRKEFTSKIGHMNHRIMEQKIRDCNNNCNNCNNNSNNNSNNNNNRRRKKNRCSRRCSIPAPSANSGEDRPMKARVQEQQVMNPKKKRPNSDMTTTYSMETDDGQQQVHHQHHVHHPKKMFVSRPLQENLQIGSTTTSCTEGTATPDQFESDLLKIIHMLSCTRIHDSS
jgi:hypothetical protein